MTTLKARILPRFPANVLGSGPVSIIRLNGTYTFGLSTEQIGELQIGSDPTQIEALVYNAITQSWQTTTLAALQSGALATSTVTHAGSPYAPRTTDFFLLIDTTGGTVEIDLPLAATRNGIALSIKDYKGNAAANSITIKPQVGETIDGYTNAAPLVLNSNYDGVRLLPVTNGYVLAP